MITLTNEEKEEALYLADRLNARYIRIDSLTTARYWGPITRYRGRPVLAVRSDWRHKGVKLDNAPHLLDLIDLDDQERIEAYIQFVFRMTNTRRNLAERRRLAEVRRHRASMARMARMAR